MKKLLVFLLIVAGAYVGYQFLTTGEIELVEKELTQEQKELAKLEADFEAAVRRYEEAGQNAQMGGPSESEDIAASLHEAERIERELHELKPRLTSDVDKAKVGHLVFEIKKLRKEAR